MTVRMERLRVLRDAGTAHNLGIRRYLPSLLLAGYGAFILSLYFRGVMTWYINPTYVAPATLAAVVLLFIAAVGARPRAAATRACGDAACTGCDDCDCEAPPRLWVYGLLAMPLALALVPPHSLAAYSARQRGPQIAGLSAIHGAAPLRRVSLSVDTSTFTLQDWVGALASDPNPGDYKNKPVVLTGMVIHNPGSVPPGYIMVIRYQVTCCIADARPEGLIVRDTSHGELKDNQWVTVHGVMTGVSYEGQRVAVVAPKTMTPVKAGDPYMY